MPFLRDIYVQLSEFLAQQSLTKKLMAGTLLVVVVGFLLYQLAHYGATIDYEILYTALDSKSANAVREELDRQRVPYKVYQAEDGWTVRVPMDKAPTLRLSLVPVIEGSGGTVGWELFDKTTLGATDYTLKINRERAIRGELERTIMAMSAVKSATVNVAIPDDSPFIRDENQPKASVLLELAPRASLNKKQVETIQGLVAGSIKGLTRDNVTVADTAGNELSRRDDGDKVEVEMNRRAVLVEQQEKQKKDYEKYLEEKILSSFSKILGPGHVTARVNVDYDFSVKEVTETKFDPKNVVRAEAQTQKGNGQQPLISEGITGTSAHVPPDSSPTSATDAGQGQSGWTAEQVKNYEVGKTETKTLFAPYQIKRITAAVFVDHLPGADGARAKPSAEDIKAFENQVKQIVNYSENRPGGDTDQVTVTSMPFSLTAIETSPEVVTKMQIFRMAMTALKYTMLGLGLLMAYLLLVRPLLRIMTPRSAPLRALEGPMAGALPGAEIAVLGGGEEERRELEAGGLRGFFPAPQTPDAMAARQQALDDEILGLTRANPKKASLVMRAWMETMGQ